MSERGRFISIFGGFTLFFLLNSFLFGQAQPAVMATGARLQGGGIPQAGGAPGGPAPNSPVPNPPAQGGLLVGPTDPDDEDAGPGMIPGVTPKDAPPEKKPIVLTTVSAPDLVYSLHSKPVTALKFAKGGAVCLSGSLDNTVQGWMTKDVFFEDTRLDGARNPNGMDGQNELNGANGQLGRNQQAKWGKQPNQPEEKRRPRSGDLRAGQRCLFLAEGHKQGITGILTDSIEENILSVSYDGTMRRWIAAKEESKKRYTGAKDRLWGAALDPSEYFVAAACNDGSVYFWTAGPAKKLGVLETGQGPVFDVDIAPESDRIVTAGADGTAKIFSLPDRNLLQTLTGHKDKVFSAKFSADGRYVLTASRDKTARIWEAASGAEVGRIVGHTGAVRRALFLPDKYVVTAGDDKTVRVWTLPDELAQIAGAAPDTSRLLNSEQAGPMTNRPGFGSFLDPSERTSDDRTPDDAENEDYDGMAESVFGDDSENPPAGESAETAETAEKTPAEPEKRAVPKGIETVRYETGSAVFSLAVCSSAIAAGCQDGKVELWRLPGPLAVESENEKLPLNGGNAL